MTALGRGAPARDTWRVARAVQYDPKLLYRSNLGSLTV